MNSRRLELHYTASFSSRWPCLLALALLCAAPARAQGDATSLYKARCVVCHGADGSGDTAVGKNMKLRDLRSADVQEQTDEELMNIIANGKGAMPAYKEKLSADEIKQLVGYIRELAKKK